MPSHECRPPLRFSELYRGRRFGPSNFATSQELVEQFVEITGDDNPLYRDPGIARFQGFSGPIVPPGLVGVWARMAYLGEHRMLPGGIMAGQDIEILLPTPVGTTLKLYAEIELVDDDATRRQVVIRAEAYSPDGLAGRVRIDARWPPDEVDV